jgi:mannose/fructose/sorbose-specific phosphotransferase system IIB component
MSFIIVRIDDRLVHGQVIESWCKKLKIDHIIVSNDAVAGDSMQRSLITLAVPSYIKVSVLTVEQTGGLLLSGKTSQDRVIVLLSSPRDVVNLLKTGFKIAEINVGGLHYSQGKVQVSKTISLSDDDLDALDELDDMGVKLEMRILPTDPKVDMN